MLWPSAFLKPMLDLAFPPRCPLCGESTESDERLCVDCWHTLDLVSDPCCPLCAAPLEGGELSVPCPDCRRAAPSHSGLCAVAHYGGGARELALAFKHRGQPGLARMMARMLAPRLGALEGSWLVVPVPLHRWRIWRRGFNQAALLGSAIAGQQRWPMLVDALVRPRATPPLEGLSRAERAAVMHNAIGCNPARAAQLQGRRLLLVDDVVTSGATTKACVGALLAAGAAEVRLACWARVDAARER